MSPTERIAFLEGRIEGIKEYAVWRDGEQRVSVMQRPLKEVIEPLTTEIYLVQQFLKERV